MSIKVMTWVWDNAEDVGGTELLLLLAIADHASDSGGDAWPSLPTLAKKTRMDERSVRRLVRKLEAKGRLKVEYNAGRKGTNLYTVVMHRVINTPDTLPPGQIDPRTAVSGEGGQIDPQGGDTRVPRTVLEPSKNRPAQVRGWRGSKIAASPDPLRSGAAGPYQGSQCATHPGSPAHNCGPCRSESLGR